MPTLQLHYIAVDLSSLTPALRNVNLSPRSLFELDAKYAAGFKHDIRELELSPLDYSDSNERHEDKISFPLFSTSSYRDSDGEKIRLCKKAGSPLNSLRGIRHVSVTIKHGDFTMGFLCWAMQSIEAGASLETLEFRRNRFLVTDCFDFLLFLAPGGESSRTRGYRRYLHSRKWKDPHTLTLAIHTGADQKILTVRFAHALYRSMPWHLTYRDQLPLPVPGTSGCLYKYCSCTICHEGKNPRGCKCITG